MSTEAFQGSKRRAYQMKQLLAFVMAGNYIFQV